MYDTIDFKICEGFLLKKNYLIYLSPFIYFLILFQSSNVFILFLLIGKQFEKQYLKGKGFFITVLNQSKERNEQENRVYQRNNSTSMK